MDAFHLNVIEVPGDITTGVGGGCGNTAKPQPARRPTEPVKVGEAGRRREGKEREKEL